MAATPGPPQCVRLARGRADAQKSGRNPAQAKSCGLGRGGGTHGRAVRALHVDDAQVRSGPISVPSATLRPAAVAPA